MNTTAPELLISAADAIGDRAQLRDQPSGERSMARAVAAFNAMFDMQLSEQHGWQFMVLLKLARSNGGRAHLDDFTDAAAYAALAGECAARHADPVGMPLHALHPVAHSKPYAPT